MHAPRPANRKGPGTSPFQETADLPALDSLGKLPKGIHDCSRVQLESRFVNSPERERLWQRLTGFLMWPESTGEFICAYIGGGFVSPKPNPSDIDVVLQPKALYGPDAFRTIEPFFAFGLPTIQKVFSVHLHFWIEGSPSGIDFRRFFQYMRPDELARCTAASMMKKGIVRLRFEPQLPQTPAAPAFQSPEMRIFEPDALVPKS